MPCNNSFRCDHFVKKSAKMLHNKCWKNQHSHNELGKHLNLLPEIGNLFDAKKHYVVCRTLYFPQILPFIQNEQNDNHTNVDENTHLNEPPPNNVPVAYTSPQQINDNESNVKQNSGSSFPLCYIHVIIPPLAAVYPI